jgi:ATP-dependent Clp protease ATP-binding subunit ClpB
VLVALLTQQDGVAAPLLEKLGILPATVLTQANAELDREPQVHGATAGGQMGQGLRGVLEAAFEEAEAVGDQYVGAEMLLVGLVAETHTPYGRLLRAAGVTKEALLEAIRQFRGGQTVTDQSPEE